MPQFSGQEVATISDEERKKRRATLEKRSASGLAKKWQDEDRAELAELEKDIAPPVVYEPRCAVCTNPFRIHIERQLLSGRSYSSIAQHTPPDPETGKNVDRRSIARHSKLHMDIDSAVTRAILEEEAGALGQQWEDGVRGAFTQRGALDILVRKAYQDAMNNVTTVEPRDMIQMIKLYNEMSTNSASTATEEAQMAIRLFIEAIQNVLTKSDLIDPDEGELIKVAIAEEVTRLRQRDEIEVVVETHLGVLPRPIYDATATEIPFTDE